MTKTEIKKKILAIDWFLSHTRKLPLFTMDVAANGYVQTSKKLFGWNYKNILMISKDGLEESFRDPKDDKRFFQFINKNEAKKKQLMIKVSKKVNLQAKKLIKILKGLPTKMSNEQLAELFSHIQQVYRGVGAALGLTRPIGLFFEKREQQKDIQDFAKVRKTHGENYGLIEKALTKSFSLLAKAWKMDKNLVRYLRADEIIKYLKNDGRPNRKELIARKKYYVLYCSEKGTFVITGQDAAQIRQAIAKKEAQLTQGNTILGKSAFKGKARGSVKIVISLDDLKKTKKGDIIVCHMTQVSFTPYLKKCAAIITDEGGVTCHAAIISRELGIPCIIGTKIATKVLKDGDLVKVDAQKGIMKIIK